MAEDDSKLTSGDPARAEWKRLMAAGRECIGESQNDKAIEHYEAAVKLAEGFGSRDVALGHALLSLARAISYHRALVACQRALGSAIGFHSGSADESLLRALAILEANLPSDRPEVIAFLSDFDLINYYEIGEDPAELVLKRVLSIREQTRGLVHEWLHVRVLGRLLCHWRKHAEADQLYSRWLQAAAAWGQEDRRVNEMVKDKADNLLAAGNASQAESLYRQALRMAEIRRRNEEQAIGKLLLGLGVILTKQARYDEAEKLLRRCLAIADDVDSCEEADALAEVLKKTGRNKEASEISNVAWKARQSYLKD